VAIFQPNILVNPYALEKVVAYSCYFPLLKENRLPVTSNDGT